LGAIDETPAKPPVVTPTTKKKTLGRRWMLYAAAGVVALLLLAAAGWLWQTRVVPGDHHEIVLADFENMTGDPGFDKALNIALSIDLKQSPYLVVAPDAKARKTLELMERPSQEQLTTSLAREVCQRIGGSGGFERSDRTVRPAIPYYSDGVGLRRRPGPGADQSCGREPRQHAPGHGLGGVANAQAAR
jgi:hypothetical protein